MKMIRRTGSVLKSLLGIVFGVVVRPRYWIVACRVSYRMVPNRWWARRPYLPIPSNDFLKFRLETQYGGSAPTPNLADVLQYLRWVDQWDSTS